MATSLSVERLVFSFPRGWLASKYDDWSFYRNQFSSQGGGIKAIDLLALSPNGDAYLIEVKDYRHPDAVRPSELPQAIADKVLMTLAALLPAKLRASDAGERESADKILQCKKLRVIAHVEQPRAHRPLVDPADLRMKLRQLLRAVDPHVKVVSTSHMSSLGWTVN